MRFAQCFLHSDLIIDFVNCTLKFITPQSGHYFSHEFRRMFTVYHSNQLDLLAKLLLAIMQSKPLIHPFQKEVILVQSPGMAQWLKLEMAKEQGIVANVEFPLPATFIWQMFTQVLSQVPQRSFFNKEAMTWKIMKVLPGLLDDPDFSELKHYLDEDFDSQKRYQLAEKIADIYDQYLVYRPQWIKAWENERAVPELENEKSWQPKLWRALYDYTLSLGQSPFHRANLYDEFIDTLGAHKQKPQGIGAIDRIFIFGISALPPRYLHALKALGEHIDIHYMSMNPCRYFWGDIRDKRYLSKVVASHQKGKNADGQGALIPILSAQDQSAQVGNSLLASMGKLGRDNLLLLSDLQCQEMDQGFVDIPRDCLLHHIQADILDLIEPGDIEQIHDSQSKREIALDDRSITVEVCHSPMREVEVLHDRLLDMLEAHPSMTPRDIIVMVADINVYSPAIAAVFGNAPGARFIPFSISDKSATQESPILSTFLRLLSLTDQRCSAAQLLEILEVPSVLRRFELDDKQFEKIKFWVEEAGIRWGLNEKTAAQFSLPYQDQNTWLFGLNRMLLGYAMPSETGLYNGILPFDEVQGLEANVAGKLVEFFRVLTKIQSALMIPKTGNLWVQTLNGFFDDMFSLDTDEELAGQLLRRQLESWLIQLNDAGFSGSLALCIVRDYLKEKLGGERMSQRFLSGRVNFCTLMPMRSIPFDVVCLLGMNDGDYPRTVAPVGFDLMVGRACPGDRSRRDDDRYLFLEALQSAQHRLYISYVGRAVQDNSIKVASVLVTELLEYCRQGYCIEGDKAMTEEGSGARFLSFMVHHNPLVPFSRQNFEGEKKSYSGHWLCAAKGERVEVDPFLSLDKPLPKGEEEMFNQGVIELTELQRFWRLPVQYFFNRRLNVFFDPPKGAMPETEPFCLDNLHRYQLRDGLLSHLIKHGKSNASVEMFYQRQKAAGTLPIHHFGALALETEQRIIEDQYKTLAPFLEGPKAPLEVNLVIPSFRGDLQLQGWLDARYALGRVLYRSGKIRANDRLGAWIDHLCQCASGVFENTHYFGVDKAFFYPAITQNEATKQLTFYVDKYLEGIDVPCPYLPSTALAGLEAFFDKKGNWREDESTRGKANAKMQLAFEGPFGMTGEGENLYVARVWPKIQDVGFDDIYTLAQQVLLPALMAATE